jgi:hypothetical protein
VFSMLILALLARFHLLVYFDKECTKNDDIQAGSPFARSIYRRNLKI